MEERKEIIISPLSATMLGIETEVVNKNWTIGLRDNSHGKIRFFEVSEDVWFAVYNMLKLLEKEGYEEK